jgi:hypothetical protein
LRFTHHADSFDNDEQNSCLTRDFAPSWYSDASAVLDLDGKVRPAVELAKSAE